MGQYWKAVNIDKREYLDPHDMGSGAKLREQSATTAIGCALVHLLAAMPEQRGGGDLNIENPTGDLYHQKVIGRWAGDRIVFVGDYAEPGDFPVKEGELNAIELYNDERLFNVSPLVKPWVERDLAT